MRDNLLFGMDNNPYLQSADMGKNRENEFSGSTFAEVLKKFNFASFETTAKSAKFPSHEIQFFKAICEPTF